MQRTIISLIAAIGKNRELGKDNKLLWHIPEDLKRFKEITNGHPIIMGRKTFESIGRVLPNRTNIIITRALKHESGSMNDENILMVNSLEQAIAVAKESPGGDEIFIIGGGQIFQQAMPLAEKLYVTIVDGSFDADVYFPEYSEFSQVISEQKGKSERYSYTFLNLARPHAG